VRLFGIFVTLAGGLALLARFLTAALLLTRLLTRRLILLAGLVLVRHVVSFHGNTIATAQSPRRSDKRKGQFALLVVSLTYSSLHFLIHCYLSLAIASYCGEFNSDYSGVIPPAYA
jgi:hypothetical protein